MKYKFSARMIFNGKIIKTASFEIEDNSFHKAADKAYKKANEGIDPYSGTWVEIKQA